MLKQPEEMDILGETLIRLDEGRRLVDPKNVRLAPTRRQLETAIHLGRVNKSTGQRVFLEGCYLGAKLCTSVEAWKRYLDRMNDA